MAEEKEQKQSPVLVGVTYCQCGCGAPLIVLEIDGQRAVHNLDEILVVFDQIGNLLDGFGVFDDEEPAGEAPRCLH